MMGQSLPLPRARLRPPRTAAASGHERVSAPGRQRQRLGTNAFQFPAGGFLLVRLLQPSLSSRPPGPTHPGLGALRPLAPTVGSGHGAGAVPAPASTSLHPRPKVGSFAESAEASRGAGVILAAPGPRLHSHPPTLRWVCWTRAGTSPSAAGSSPLPADTAGCCDSPGPRRAELGDSLGGPAAGMLSPSEP